MNISQYNLTNDEFIKVKNYLELLHERNCLIDIQGIQGEVVYKDNNPIEIYYNTENWTIIDNLKTKEFKKILK